MSEKSLTQQAITRGLMFALLVIPTAISIFLAIEFKSMTSITHEAITGEPQIVCFDPDVCAIEVYSKWYRIDGVIVQEDIVPEEYRLEELLSEAEAHRDPETIEEDKRLTDGR